MAKLSDGEQNELRRKILGMGEFSLRKSYYPMLQERLRELELYKTLLNEANDAIGMVDLDSFRFVDLNNSARQWFAVSLDEPLPVLTELFDAAAVAVIRQWREALNAGGDRVLKLTTQLRLQEEGIPGEYADLNLSHVRCDDCDYAVAVLRDVTEQRTTYDALQESERRYKRLVSAVPSGICLIADRVMLEINQRMCEITGYERDELIGHTTRHLYASEADFLDYGQRILAMLDQREVGAIEMYLIRKDGRRIETLMTFSPLDRQNLHRGIVYSVLDITGRMQAEQALRESENKLKSIINVAPVGIILAVRRIIKEANPRLCEITGYSREELLERSSRIFYFSEADFDQAGDCLYGSGPLRHDATELRWRHKDGHAIDVVLSLAFIDPHDPDQGVTFAIMDITDRKLSEQARRESENKLKSIVDVAPVGIILAVDRTLKETNPRLCEITGYSREELLNRNARFLYFSEEDFEKAGQLVYSERPDRNANMVELRWRHKDGHPIEVMLYFNPLDAADWSQGTTFIVMDITDKKDAEEALRASERMMRSILSSVPSGIGVVQNRIFHEANQRFCEITGYSREELLGQNTRIVYWAEKDYLAVKEDMYPQIRSGDAVTGETRWRHKDGRRLDILLSLTLVDPAQPDGMVTFTALDITEQKEAEAALRASEENLRTTLNSIGDAVIASDCSGRITRLNPVATTLTGWPIEEALGQPLEAVFRIVDSETRQPVESPIRKVLASGQVHGLSDHTLLLARDGREFHIADSGAPIRNSQGEIIGMVLVFHDTTRQYELEEKLRQSQKMESIGKLAGGVAHDFNNMLTGIMASADLLSRRIGDANPGAITLVGIIRDSCQKAADLTQKLLAFARKAKLVSRPVEIHAAVGTAVSLLERSIDRRIEIVPHFTAEHSTITGDPSQITNLFLNLGVNARDAMPDGGIIMIETDNLYLDRARCAAFAFNLTPGLYLHIRVRDTGCGIPPEILGHIFEPFFTTKEVGKGSGLGLSAVYGAVQEHNGAIEVESEPGNGTIFDIYFPCIDGVPSPPAEEEPLPRGSGCILIIDDEELVRYTAQEILEEIGFQVIPAMDGLDGLEKYRQHQTEVTLVILDMIMPRMNGQECFAELRKLNPSVKVIISTGYVSDRTTNAAYPDGAMGFIRKPFTITELHREISRVMALESPPASS